MVQRGYPMNDIIKTLEHLVEIQTTDGNWNYDTHMHGMANGMILMLATVKGETPKFLDAPDEWWAKEKSDDK